MHYFACILTTSIYMSIVERDGGKRDQIIIKSNGIHKRFTQYQAGIEFQTHKIYTDIIVSVCNASTPVSQELMRYPPDFVQHKWLGVCW